jgi:predicted GTPase
MPRKIIIMGAAGKDFHVFNMCYRNNPEYKVVAFTATQIPNIDERLYPPQLAGEFYPQGIPIRHERFLGKLIRENSVDEVIFAYSDVSNDYVKEREKVARKAGAEFKTINPQRVMLRSSRRVIAICAVRTGAGKSPTSRKIARILKKAGKQLCVMRHPMPYGNLVEQTVQKFERIEDLHIHGCTIEEMEEYEPHLREGTVVFAGVDYEKILREAEKDFEIILWDGGNNDTPFLKPDLHITVTDPLRAGHELTHFPGRQNFEMADVILINKINEAKQEEVSIILENAKRLNPDAIIVKAESCLFVENPGMIEGKKVLVIEDGPSVTHGETRFGAAYIASLRYQAKEIIDPRKYAVGSICKTYEEYPHLQRVLPAMGYGRKQMKELEETINAAECDLIVIGTPVDLGRILKINKPWIRVTYELSEVSTPTLKDILQSWKFIENT